MVGVGSYLRSSTESTISTACDTVEKVASAKRTESDRPQNNTVEKDAHRKTAVIFSLILPMISIRKVLRTLERICILCIFSCRRFEQALEDGEPLIRSVDEVSKQVPGHKRVGRQASFNLMEKSLAVRVAMIELLKAFDCVEGASHVTTAVGGGLEHRYDYVKSLWKHVDALATLLLYWKSMAAGMFKTCISFQIGSTF